MKRYKAVFFDLDDTLWDCHSNVLSAFKQVYSQFELSHLFGSFNRFMALYFPYNQKMWELYNRDLIDKEELNRRRFSHPFQQIGFQDEAFVKRFMETYLSVVSAQPKLIDGAKAILEFLYPKYPLYILSNGFVETQYKKLEAGGIRTYFKNIYLSDAIGVNKPDVHFFEFVLNDTGLSCGEAIMVGDNLETDIKGAYNSGIDQVYYDPVSASTSAESIVPTFRISRLKELESIL